jgi:hypothetical protein
MEKYEFGGPEWTEVLRAAWQAALDRMGDSAAGITVSISEHYLDPPAHLAPPTGELGWRAEIKEGRFLFDPTPSHDVDIDIEADYKSILPLARLVLGTDPEKQATREQMVGELVSSGKLVVRGDMSVLAGVTESVHDSVAVVTA